MEKFARLKCNFCNETFRINYLYTDNLDRETKCPHCGIMMSAFGFDFITMEVEEDEKTS
jgi:DNA-directed RNA polymerase subunit RPC12/RpoP